MKFLLIITPLITVSFSTEALELILYNENYNKKINCLYRKKDDDSVFSHQEKLKSKSMKGMGLSDNFQKDINELKSRYDTDVSIEKGLPFYITDKGKERGLPFYVELGKKKLYERRIPVYMKIYLDGTLVKRGVPFPLDRYLNPDKEENPKKDPEEDSKKIYEEECRIRDERSSKFSSGFLNSMYKIWLKIQGEKKEEKMKARHTELRLKRYKDLTKEDRLKQFKSKVDFYIGD